MLIRFIMIGAIFSAGYFVGYNNKYAHDRQLVQRYADTTDSAIKGWNECLESIKGRHNGR